MSGPKSLIIVLIFVAVLLAVIYIVGCSGSSTGGESRQLEQSSEASPVLSFASLQPVEGSVISALQANGVSITQVPAAHEISYDALVVDGALFRSRDSNLNELIREYLKSGRGVLLINADVENKLMLQEHIGISYGDHFSPGFFVTTLPDTHGREYAIIDHPRPLLLQSSDMSVNGDPAPEIDEEQLQAEGAAFENIMTFDIGPTRFARAIVNRLLENKRPARDDSSRDVEPSPYLKYRKWYVDQTESPTKIWKFNTAWIYSFYVPLYWEYEKWVYPSGSPMKGWQQGAYGHTTLITLYLDNDPNNMGQDFQWLTIDHQGWWDTVDGDNHSINSGSGDNATVEMPLSNEKDTKYQTVNETIYDAGTRGSSYYGFGWGVMGYYFKFLTPAAEQGNFKYVSGIPQNEITNTTHTESANFIVGFSKAGVSSSFNVGKSITTTVPSWKVDVDAQPAASSFHWVWHSNDPDWQSEKISGFNTLIKDGYEPPAYGVLQTHTVLDRKVTFDMGYGVLQYTTVARGADQVRFNINRINDFQYAIDFGAVLYPLVEKLSISPDSVVGGTTTTGTVTLDQNAPAGGIEVELASNNTNWATVPATITVPEGQGAQTFEISTYPVSGNSAVTITATVNRVSASADLTVEK